MPYGIDTVTVIGAGTMGAAIAAHLANSGISVHLLDMTPTELTGEEVAAGLSLDDRRVRNRIVKAGFERMRKAKPENLYLPEYAERIQLGNIDDDLATAVEASDWVIEAIIERPGPKQELMQKIDAIAGSHTIVSTNTSGIPIHVIGEKCSDEFQRRFLGTHFFNPPRYLHLLEIIPTGKTDPTVTARMRQFAEHVLGKGVVICKDTPNFVANRLITFIQCDTIEFAVANGYTVEEVDQLTGQLVGRPKTGTFRLSDVIGIDVMTMVSDNLYPMIPHDPDREILRAEHSTAVLQALVANNLLGSKSGQGFYKTVMDESGEKTFWGLDLAAAAETGDITYLAPQKPRWESVGEARNLPLAQRLQRLVEANDNAGTLIWHTLSNTMAYASKRIPEIADRITDIDNATKWGFGWQMGPFEIWDGLGVPETVRRMEAENITVAGWVHEMLDQGFTQFYDHDGQTPLVYDPLSKQYQPVQSDELDVRISDLKQKRAPVAGNDSATLLQMDDGVLLLEFHSKMNALDADIFVIMQKAIERLHADATGLVIANEGTNFSVGANLVLMGMAAQSGQWRQLEEMIRQGQQAFMALRRAPKPVVAAPFQRALGGGAEVCLTADRIVAHAETYIGLVEIGVGIVPGWGGCKEIVRRLVSPHMHATNVYSMPYLRQAFELIGFAKVSSSAAEARKMGFVASNDRIVMNRDHLLWEAHQEVLQLAHDGYTPPKTTGNVYAGGRNVLSGIHIEVYSLRQGGYISGHDAHIANKLGYVLCGGELSAPAWMDEQYFLDLEREAVLSLAGEAKTQERIWHMLKNGKPLRN